MTRLNKLSKNALGMLISRYKAVLTRLLLKGSLALAASCILFSGAPAAADEYPVAFKSASDSPIYLYGASPAFYGDIEIFGQKNSGSGSAVFLSGGSVLNANSIILTDNEAGANAGAAYIANAGRLIVNGKADFSGNKALGASGGALFFIDGGQAEFRGNTSFTNNQAQGQGGAAYLQNDGRFTVSGTANFSGNKALDGGALFLINKGWITFNGNTVFTGNAATGQGGAAYLQEAGHFDVNGTVSFSGNTAQNGGALFVYYGSWIDVTHDATFVNNVANRQSGAAYIEGIGTRLSVVGKANFSGNKALGAEGGALVLIWGGEMSAGEAVFSGNEAAAGGGAVHIRGNAGSKSQLTITGKADFNNNKAGENGGALYIWGETNKLAVGGKATFSGNSARDGGAVYLREGGIISAAETVFTKNTAQNHGGAAYLSGGSKIEPAKFTFTDNKAGASGGALYLDGSKLDVSEDFFVGNQAGASGGAAALYNKSELIVDDTVFDENSAALNGGAVYLAGESTLIANYGYFYNNSAQNHGGALYFGGKNTFIGNKANFADNTAKYGGAMYLNTNGNELNIAETIDFIGNYASLSGGAAYLADSNKLKFEKTAYFYENMAKDSGGALFLAGNNTFTATNAYFDGNLAQGFGGAIYAGNNSAINLITTSTGHTVFANNKHQNSAAANAIYFGGGASSLTVSGAGMMDMYDPLAGSANADNINISKTGSGIWKLGGNNQFSGNSTNFTVGGGMLELYQDGKIDLKNGSFTVNSGATFASLGNNQLNVGSGLIDFQDNSTLAFDLSKAIAAGNPGTTVNLITTGNFSSGNPNVNIDILALKADGTPQRFKLMESDTNISLTPNLTLRGGAINPGSRVNSASVSTEQDGNKYVVYLDITAKNGVVTWTPTVAERKWDATLKNWDATAIDGNTSQQFLHGDAVVFNGTGETIEIDSHGVQIEAHGSNVGMEVDNSGGTYKFTGGAIEGGGGLTKTGGGTLILANNNNSYLGETKVEGGILIGNVTEGTKMTVAGGATYLTGDGGLNVADGDRIFTSLNGDGTVDMKGQNLAVGSGDFSGGTLLFDGGTTKGILTKYTDHTINDPLTDIFTIGDVDVGRVDVLSGTLKIANGKKLTIDGIFGSASDGILDVYDGATLAVDAAAAGSDPIVTAHGVNFHHNAVLEIKGITYNNSAYTSDTDAAAGNVTIIKSDTPISEIYHYKLVDDTDTFYNNADASQIKERYLTASAGLSADKLSVVAGMGLAWNDGHQNAANQYDKAHGTFKIDSGLFTINGVLADRGAGEYKSGWDGRTLTKTGGGTLTLSGDNTYSGGTLIEAGTLNVTNANALGTGNVINKANLEFNLTADGTLIPNIQSSGTLTKKLSTKLTLAGNVFAEKLKIDLNGGMLTLAGGISDLGAVDNESIMVIGDGISAANAVLGSYNAPATTRAAGLFATKNDTLIIEKNAQAIVTGNAVFNNLITNGTISFFNTAATQGRNIGITNYTGSGIISIQGAANSSEKWIDLITFGFPGFQPDNGVAKVHVNFAPGSSLHYIEEEQPGYFKFAEFDNYSGNSFADPPFELYGTNIGLGAYDLSIDTNDNGKSYYLTGAYNSSVAEVYPEDSASALEQVVFLNNPVLYKSVSSAIKAAADGGTGIYVIGEKLDFKNSIGSANNIKGNRFLAATAWTKNKLAFGLLGQKFDGTYQRSHIATVGGAPYVVNSSGELSYYDAGFFAEHRPQGFLPDGSGTYYNIIVKGGRSSDDFHDNRLADFHSVRKTFDISLGIGRVKNYNENKSVDFYNHLIYTRVGGDDFTDSLGEVIHFSAADSLRLLLGARFHINRNQKTAAYLGGALDYEFKGDASATIDGHQSSSNELKGLSGFLEMGFSFKHSETVNIDAGIQGYFGKRRGLGGTLMLSKKF